MKETKAAPTAGSHDVDILFLSVYLIKKAENSGEMTKNPARTWLNTARAVINTTSIASYCIVRFSCERYIRSTRGLNTAETTPTWGIIAFAAKSITAIKGYKATCIVLLFFVIKKGELKLPFVVLLLTL
jgi:hypothetical protein